MFGLFQVYYGLAYITSILPILCMLVRTPSAEGVTISLRTVFGSTTTLTVTSMVVTVALAFGLAWLLIFRASWLADKLKIPKQDDQPPISGNTILEVGAKLIAIFVIMHSVPDLLKAVGEILSHAKWFLGVGESYAESFYHKTLFSDIFAGILPGIVKLSFGVFLAIRTQTVLNWIDGRKGMTEQQN